MLEEAGYQVNLWDPYFIPDESVLNRTYAIIFACEVIEHFHDPRTSFCHLRSLLSQRGVLYCRTSLIPDDRDFTSWGYKNEETHVFFYHEKTIAWIAEHILKCSYTIFDEHVIAFSLR